MTSSERRRLGGTCATLAALSIGVPLVAQHPPLDEVRDGSGQPSVEEGVDYRVYDRWGNPTSLLGIVSRAVADDVILVGEEHDDMVGHALETALFRTVLDEIGVPETSGRTVVLSLEMFERDVQYVLDEYLAGLISEEHFLRSSRPWDDYGTRYRPLVEMAREHGAPVVAANAPRRYVSRVTSEGPGSLDELSELARGYLPPLPYPGPSIPYREQWNAIMEAAMSAAAVNRDEVGPEVDDADPERDTAAVEGGERAYSLSPNAIYAQALWDASMGHAIAQALMRRIGAFVVHFAGSFHVEKGTGIVERIADYRPGTRVTTVVMTKVTDIDGWSAEEHGPLADYVVLTRMPTGR